MAVGVGVTCASLRRFQRATSAQFHTAEQPAGTEQQGCEVSDKQMA